MQKLFYKYKYLILLFFLLSMISLFIFLPYLITDTEFVLGWDMRTLYSSNFEALRNLFQSCLKNHEFPFWSWTSFLGNDYYSSKLFYFQDFFDYPFAFTNLPYYTIIKIQTYIKFLVAGYSFYAYARFNKYKHTTSIIGSLMFAFSAYGLQTMMHPFFASFFVFLPLYFLAVDNYIYNKKTIGYICITFLLIINNYYLFYSVSIFTVLYFIYRYYTFNQKIKGFFKNAIPLIYSYFIAVFMSALILLPEALSILENNRVGDSSSFFFYDSIIPYLNYIVGIFIPTSIFANRSTPISEIYSYVSTNESVMAIFIWASSLLILLFPQLFNTKKQAKQNFITFGIITLFALVPFLSSFMHGFSEPSFRWLQSPTFLLIASILPLIDNFSKIKTIKLKHTLITSLFIIIFSSPLIAYISGKDFSLMLNDYILILPFTLTLVIMYISLTKQNIKLVLITIVTELSICSLFSFYLCPFFSSFDKKTISQIHHVLQDADDFNNYTISIDESNNYQFYRTYVDPISVYWDMSINLNLDFNIMGLMAYDSTYNSTTNDLKQIYNIEEYLPWTFSIKNPNLLNLLCTKYAIVTEESQVPFNNYVLVGEFNYFEIYENIDYYNLGKTYNNIITYEEYENIDQIKNNIICKKSDYNEISKYLGNEIVYFDSVIRSNNSLYANIQTSEKGFAVISVPNDRGWKVSVNGEDVKTYQVNGGLMGIPLSAGYNEIYLHFTPYGLKIGLVISFIGFILFIMEITKKKH